MQSRRWVDEICSEWNFSRIIPCHYAAPLRAGPSDLRRAFSFLYDDGTPPLPAAAAAAASSDQGGFLGRLLGGAKAAAAAATAGAGGKGRGVVFPEEDMAVLNGLEGLLRKSGVLYGKPKAGGGK